MASFSFNSVGVAMVKSENCSLILHRSEGGLHVAPETLSLSPPINLINTTKSDDLLQSGSLPSLRSAGVGFASFAIATMAGISFLSTDSFAMASELDLGNSTITTHISNPNPNPNPSFTMAIPIPYKEVWVFVQNGFVAPLPNTRDGSVIPIPHPRKAIVSSKGPNLRCPQWTPSELEMVLPNFHGRPKPFPRQGHQWQASFVVKGMHDEAFLQVSHLKDGVEFDEIASSHLKDGVEFDEIASSHKKTMAVVAEANGEEMKGKLSVLKVLGVEKFMCFSM